MPSRLFADGGISGFRGDPIRISGVTPMAGSLNSVYGVFNENGNGSSILFYLTAYILSFCNVMYVPYPLRSLSNMWPSRRNHPAAYCKW